MSTTSDIAIRMRINLMMDYGGLPRPEMRNQEWLYMLKEETRNSILIEGIFVSDEELEEVLNKGGTALKKSQKEALNYYKTAKNFYNLSYEASRDDYFSIRPCDIRNIQNMLFDNINVIGEKGAYRKGDIQITGAKIKPPSGFYIDKWLNFYVDYVNEYLISKPKNFLDFIAKQHILFESIHPFSDGNGRTGRILTNGLLLCKKYPLVIFKGVQSKRKKYYKALEEGDEVLRPLTSNFNKDKLVEAMKNMKVNAMKTLIKDGLIGNFDRILIRIMGYSERLRTIDDVSKDMDCDSNTIRTMINRGEFIALKKGKQWFTHNDLYLTKILTLEDFREIINDYKNKGILESKFAELIGYSKQYINKLKEGEKPITLEFKKKLMNFLGKNT